MPERQELDPVGICLSFHVFWNLDVVNEEKKRENRKTTKAQWSTGLGRGQESDVSGQRGAPLYFASFSGWQ